MVLVPDREALTGFVMPLVPVVVLCQGTEQHFAPTSCDYQGLSQVASVWPRAGLSQARCEGQQRCWLPGKKGLGSLPC